jgi:hypothetical protein
MSSDNPTGAVNQQGSRSGFLLEPLLTPQRLHAELLATDAKSLEAYLQGALRDGTRSALHRTHRIGAAERGWLVLLQQILNLLDQRSWIYREGARRNYWILETTASFLDMRYDANALAGSHAGLAYVRGYFDADGGMPVSSDARLYFQFTQNSRDSLAAVAANLAAWGIETGRIHHPSVRVDPEYWRLYVRAGSHRRFMALVRSWHPRKRQQIETRMKI